MKKLLNALPLFIAILLLAYSCNRSPSNNTTSPNPVSSNASKSSEVWKIKEGSIYDGDTLRVVKGSEELKIRLCGIDAPEKKQDLGVASRDYLRSLVNKGNGQIYVVPALSRDPCNFRQDSLETVALFKFQRFLKGDKSPLPSAAEYCVN